MAETIPAAAMPGLDGFAVVGLPDAAAKLVGFNGQDIQSRPFNLLRTQLAKALASKKAHLVGITSATPAAGKSFLSLNLAASLARLGDNPVYLVDLDLRRGSLADQLSLDVSKGVDAFLSGQADTLEQIGLRIDSLPLVILPTNVVPSGSDEYVSGPRYGQFLELVRSQTNGATVLFDLPPVFASDDTAISMQGLDGYIMIVDAGKTSKRQLIESMDMLRPAMCLGFILNKYKGGLLDTYGYSSYDYNKYYKYSSDRS